jgi:hypothetical protein
MGLHDNVETLEQRLVLFASNCDYHELHYLIIGREPTTNRVVDFFKQTLDKLLDSAIVSVKRQCVKENNGWVELPVENYIVGVYDVKEVNWAELFFADAHSLGIKKDWSILEYMRAIGNIKENGVIFIPIFKNVNYVKKNSVHGISDWSGFVMSAFDAGAPSILSMTRPDYRDTEGGGGFGSRISCYQKIYPTKEFFKKNKIL